MGGRHVSAAALWRRPDFLKLWTAESVSLLGSQVSVLAIPLAAADALAATAFQMGVLRALSFAPVLLFGLLAGAWLDGIRRRPVLIVADLGRVALLAIPPLAALAGVLRIEVLYAVAFLVGTLTLLFDIAQTAWLPSLVEPERLVDGNSKLELSRWICQVGGPGAAGVAVQVLGAPLAIALDACSFLVSAVLVGRIRTPEPPPPPRTGRAISWPDIRAGIEAVARDPLLRTITLCAGASNLFAYAQAAILVLYITRDLQLPASGFATVLAGFGLGGVLGASVAPRAAARLGLGGSIVCGVALMATGDSLVALVPGSSGVALAVLTVGQFLNGLGLPLFTVSAVSLRQSVVPAHLLARVIASSRLVTWGALPIGALLGGVLGDAIGLHGTLVVAAVGAWLVVVPVARSAALRAARPESSASGAVHWSTSG